MNKTSFRIVILLFIISAWLNCIIAASFNIKPDTMGYANVNNVKLYFEIYGSGEPLLLLHGGLGSGASFEKYIPDFAKFYKVIIVDRKGHGRSYDNKEPYSYAAMGESMNAFMENLHIDSAYVIGWSDGGVVGFHLAAKHPEKVKKLITAGANYLVNGLGDDFINWTKTNMYPDSLTKNSPGMEEGYNQVNPTKNNFANYINNSREMWLHDPYISKEDLLKIKAPVLLVAGDKDIIKIEHTIEIYRLLKSSQLLILPDTSHSVFAEMDKGFFEIMLKFLRN